MPFALRLILILATWGLCFGLIRKVSPLKAGAFVNVQATGEAAKSAVPFFRKELINPDQGLTMVHVASLAQLPDGITAAVWYGGSAECHPDVKIYFSEKESEGTASWSAPRVIMTRETAARDLDRPVKSLGNALLLAKPDGSLRLLFVTIAMGRWSGSQLNSSLSTDGGMTWSRAERLTLSPFFNFSELVRNRAIAQSGGGWCVPVYQEFLGKFPELLWLGEKNGRLTARKTRIAGGCSTLQPSLIPLGEDDALVLLRDYTDARMVFVSRSQDGGLNWSKPEGTALPNPDAGISGLKLSDGRILIAFNNSTKDRSDLSLALSGDQGQHWKKLATLESESNASFSYPYLMRTHEGLIYMAYTWKGKLIKMVSFNEAWITEHEARP